MKSSAFTRSYSYVQRREPDIVHMHWAHAESPGAVLRAQVQSVAAVDRRRAEARGGAARRH